MVPEALPAECSVMSPPQAGKHRVALSMRGSWIQALVCNRKRPSWSHRRQRLQVLLLCRFRDDRVSRASCHPW